MSDGVFSWWCLLCALSALNITAWVLAAAALRRQQSLMSVAAYAVCRQQLLLSAVYVFGCAYRSVLPVFDVPRICLFDVWLSSALVGRSVASAAELCFVAQWALILRTAERVSDSMVLRSVSRLLVPLIVAAEVCSWWSVLTTSNLGHVIEEAIWGLSAVLAIVALVAFHPRCPRAWRPAVLTGVIAGIPYAAYMFLVDVPRYWNRWVADEAQGQAYLTFTQGLRDALQHRVVSHSWDVWKGEVVWMTLYFSVAVWISISLVHASMVQVRSMGEKCDAHSGARVPVKRSWLRSRTAE